MLNVRDSPITEGTELSEPQLLMLDDQVLILRGYDLLRDDERPFTVLQEPAGSAGLFLPAISAIHVSREADSGLRFHKPGTESRAGFQHHLAAATRPPKPFIFDTVSPLVRGRRPAASVLITLPPLTRIRSNQRGNSVSMR